MPQRLPIGQWHCDLCVATAAAATATGGAVQAELWWGQGGGKGQPLECN